MRIAVLGGSFNPVHNGHVALAAQACDVLGYDKVIFIPAFKPPHKEMNECLPAEQRIKLLEAACTDSRFEWDDCEIKRGGISYTYDTICSLEEKYRDVLTDKIGLIMGTDLHAGFHLWYRAAELAEKCQIILARRPEEKTDSGYSNQPSGKYAQINKQDFSVKDEPLFKNAVVLENPLLKISSTLIRKMASCGEDFSSLVPRGVFDYIVQGNLYGNIS